MEYTNKYNLPESIVRALLANTYDIDKNKGNIFSATTLVSPPKIVELTRRHWSEIEEDASENIWRLLGSAVHIVLELASRDKATTEKRMFVKMPEGVICEKPDDDGIYISGKPDHFEGSLDDFKITSAWSIIFEPEGKTEWHQQLNIYDWMLQKDSIVAENLRVIAILRDWSKTKAKTDPRYPPIPLAVVDIPMWTHDRQTKYINERLELHKEAQLLADDEIPICSQEERWEKPTKYAMMKGTNVRAVKVFDSKELAEEAVRSAGIIYRIQTRPGKATRCLEYCAVKDFCNYYRENYGGKDDE